MALKIVTGGTTGAADGTLVSSSNKIVFTALDTPIDCHIRADDDTYSADASFSMPSDGAVQVSFDGGSTWKAFANNPASYGADIGDLNIAIKLRQHANATASTGTFQTDATTPAATALADVTGFGATGGNAQVALSWSAVTNRTAYRVDRATDSGFTTGVALDIFPGLTATSLTDTGRTNGTTYYYRIKAVGTNRYKDSASYATANATPVSDTYSTTVLGRSGILNYWRLGETSGSFVDSQSGKSGTLSGSGSTRGSAAVTLKTSDAAALTLNGSGLVSVAHDSAFNVLTDKITLEAWVVFDALPGTSVAYDILTKAGAWYLQLYNSAGTRKLYVSANNGGIGVPGTYAPFTDGGVAWSPSTGTVYHIVGVLDNSTGGAYLYVNGSLLGSTVNAGNTHAIDTSSNPINIGGYNAVSNLVGRIDSAAIYHAALDSTAVAANYAAGT